ncbi:uncharacterized protein BJ171DRAFT_72006 [Polychytrium aggregatum]|uniref:uncharacterized protein n=1 Tax=Polychytrium aggregatum TaxID=110093 RepID=UPI0022FED256|nr:uncharacterized protein BJ171DRAFT_72006 [Polychytrium aggregatum]KAI9205335.1 hypothetical protein BJ171DRAFT_72006 [Polychytrium aggregatum]
MLALPSEDVSDALHDSLQALSLSKSGEAPLGESFAQVQCSLEVYGELIQERERAVEEGYESSSVLDPIRQDLESLKDALQAMVQRELKHRENTFKKIARVKDEIAQHCLWLGEDLAQHVNDSTVSSKSSLYRQLVDLEQIRGAVGEIVKERAALWLSLVAEIRAISSRLGYDTGEYVPAPGCYSLASLDGLRSKIGLLSQELHHKIQILATLFLALIDTAREADITIVDSVLSPLCQDLSAVLAMDSVGDRPVTAQEYIRSQGIALSDDFTSQVRAALETIQKQYGQKLEALNIVIREIHMFWDQMGAPVQNRMELPPLLSRYQEYRQLADYLRIEWKRQMEDQVNKLLERLQELWIKCHVNESERESFMNKIKENLYSPVTVEMLNEQIKILEQRYEQCHQLFVKIEKRTAFIEKIVDFEKRAQDKNRLFRPSFQLVEEEKFRKTCFPTLLNMESDLHRDVLAFESDGPKLPVQWRSVA